MVDEVTYAIEENGPQRVLAEGIEAFSLGDDFNLRQRDKKESIKDSKHADNDHDDILPL